jgi:hypothetical protein
VCVLYSAQYLAYSLGIAVFCRWDVLVTAWSAMLPMMLGAASGQWTFLVYVTVHCLTVPVAERKLAGKYLQATAQA